MTSGEASAGSVQADTLATIERDLFQGLQFLCGQDSVSDAPDFHDFHDLSDTHDTRDDSAA